MSPPSILLIAGLSYPPQCLVSGNFSSSQASPFNCLFDLLLLHRIYYYNLALLQNHLQCVKDFAKTARGTSHLCEFGDSQVRFLTIFENGVQSCTKFDRFETQIWVRLALSLRLYFPTLTVFSVNTPADDILPISSFDDDVSEPILIPVVQDSSNLSPGLYLTEL